MKLNLAIYRDALLTLERWQSEFSNKDFFVGSVKEELVSFDNNSPTVNDGTTVINTVSVVQSAYSKKMAPWIWLHIILAVDLSNGASNKIYFDFPKDLPPVQYLNVSEYIGAVFPATGTGGISLSVRVEGGKLVARKWDGSNFAGGVQQVNLSGFYLLA